MTLWQRDYSTRCHNSKYTGPNYIQGIARQYGQKSAACIWLDFKKSLKHNCWNKNTHSNGSKKNLCTSNQMQFLESYNSLSTNFICNKWFISLSRGNELDEGRNMSISRSATGNTDFIHWNSQQQILQNNTTDLWGWTRSPNIGPFSACHNWIWLSFKKWQP